MSLELDTLLYELDKIEGCERTKAKVRHLLRTLAGQRVYFAKSVLIRPVDVQRVRNMMADGIDGMELREAVIERLTVSVHVAYRLIRLAKEPVRVNLDCFEAGGMMSPANPSSITSISNRT